MNVSLRPPDFFRLFAADPAAPPALPPPPLPEPGTSYTQFGGTYSEPQVAVPPLASFGREQLYDERCLTDPPPGWAPSGGGGDAAWPTSKGELRRRVRSTGDASA